MVVKNMISSQNLQEYVSAHLYVQYGNSETHAEIEEENVEGTLTSHIPYNATLQKLHISVENNWPYSSFQSKKQHFAKLPLLSGDLASENF